MKFLSITFFAFLSIVSCQKSEQLTLKSAQDKTELLSDHAGKRLMETYCLQCHKPQGDHQGRLAPPMAMVKQHYYDEGMDKEKFVQNIVSWVEDPDWDHLKMNGAARRFGIMPKQGIPKDSIRKIAEYIYEYPFKNEVECNEGMGERRRRGMFRNKS